MPIVSNQVFTGEGYLYNVSAVLYSHLRLNETAYALYSQPRIAVIFGFNYAIGFAAVSCILVHTCLNEGIHIGNRSMFISFDCKGKTIANRFRSSVNDVVDDIYSRLMAQYPEAPEWWYDSNVYVRSVVQFSLQVHSSISNSFSHCFDRLYHW